MTELPENWKVISLGEIVSINTGKIDANKAVEGGKYPFFTCARDISYIDDAPFEGKVVLVAGNGDLNVKYYEGKFNAYQRTYFLKSLDENNFLPRYIYLFMEHYLQVLRTKAIGTTIKYIKKENLTEAEIPVPPISEQHKIVELLEDHLSRLDAALADVKQAKTRAAQYRVAFLRKACRGDSDWDLTSLKDLGNWAGGGTPSKANELFWSNGTVPWLSPKDMGPLEITETIDKITEDACNNSTVKKIPANSIAFVVRSGILERKLPISILKIETTLNQDMKALTFSKSVNPKFVFYSLLGLEQDILNKCRKSGTTVASLNTSSLLNYEIRMPDLQVQSKVVDYIESQIVSLDRSLENLEFVLKTVSGLRRSLLQAAFTGQLTNEVTNV